MATWKLRNHASWKKLWDSSRKHKGSVNAGHAGIRVKPDGDAFMFFPRGYDNIVELGRITPDDIFTVTCPTDNLFTWRPKFAWLIGVNVYSHKKTRTQVNTLKVQEAGSMWREAYPFVSGMQYAYINHAYRCTNREIGVQLVRRVKPEVQAEVTKALAPLSAACRVIRRLNGYDRKEANGWWVRKAEVEAKLETLTLEQVTTEAVTPQEIFELGAGATTGIWRFQWGNNDNQQDFMQRAVDNGLRLLREHFYRRLDGYVIVADPNSD